MTQDILDDDSLSFSGSFAVECCFDGESQLCLESPKLCLSVWIQDLHGGHLGAGIC
jgi:hypothetical protein